MFHEVKDCRTVSIRCGQCIGCRIEKQQAWAIRCLAESKCHEDNVFVTLTYEDLPMHGSLNYSHFQQFMRRLRHWGKQNGYKNIRFFMCGEYGENLARPHYHALLFGVRFPDAVKSNSVYSRTDVFSSEILSKLWGKGFCTIGEVNYATAQYVASYVLKRHTVTSDSDDHYRRVDVHTGELIELKPEFAQMSLKPGIGLAWLETYWRDLYTTGHNAVIVNGTKKRIPRYYSEKMRELQPIFMESYDWEQERRALENWEDNTPERLAVKEAVTRAALKFTEERKR